MNRSSNKEVIFIDKGIENFASLAEKLVKSSDVDYQIVYLDKAENAFSQMADYLSNQSNLDAIHVFSHGAEATIKLADNYISEKDLEIYVEELKIIGNSLRQNGDIMLYGCDIAASKEGERFIQTFADLTGADISASQDKTGNSTIYNANWVLERSIGEIETQELYAEGFEEVLYTYVSDHKLKEKNQPLLENNRGSVVDVTYDLFRIEIFNQENPLNVSKEYEFNILGNKLGIDSSLIISHFELALPIDLSFNIGSFDIEYPVKLAIATPNAVSLLGGQYTVKTGLYDIENPVINISDWGINANLYLSLKSDIETHLGFEWDVLDYQGAYALLGETNDNGLSYKTEKFNIDYDLSLLRLTNMEKEGVSFTILPDTWFSQTFSTRKKQGGEAGEWGILNSKNTDWIDYNFYDIASTKHQVDQADFTIDENGFFDFNTKLTKPLASVTLDIDDLLGAILEKNPTTFSVGKFITALDGEYYPYWSAKYDRAFSKDMTIINENGEKEKIGKNSWLFGKTEFRYSILSSDITVALNTIVETKLDVKNIALELKDSLGTTRNGYIGDSFTFYAPTEKYSKTYHIDTKSILQGELSTKVGIGVSASFNMNWLNVNGSLLGFNFDASSDERQISKNLLGWLNFPLEWTLLESKYSFEKELGSSRVSVYQTGNTTSETILDMSGAPTRITVSVLGAEKRENGWYEVVEGNNGLTDANEVSFKVVRTGDLNKEVTIHYNFELGEDVDDNDFVEPLKSGTLHFSQGEKEKIVTVKINGDLEKEADEDFIFKISSSEPNTKILNAETIVTILSDDPVLYKMRKDEVEYTGSAKDEEIFANRQDNIIFSGAGNDTIHLHSGQDYVHAGSGNDIVNIKMTPSPFANKVYYNGGDGVDTLNFENTRGYSSLVYWDREDNLTTIGFSSKLSEIEDFLTQDPNLGTFGYRLNTNDNVIRVKNVEIINMIANYDSNLFVYWGGEEYRVNNKSSSVFNYNTFYADWSKFEEDIIWQNGSTVIGNKVSVSGIDKLLLRTGMGTNNIDLSHSERDNEIIGGLGKLIYTSSYGNDTVYGSETDDIFNVTFRRYASSTIDGRSGVDTLNLNLSETSGGGHFLVLDKDNNLILSTTGASSAAKADFLEIRAALKQYDHIAFAAGYYSPSIVVKNVEKINVMGSDGNDLIIYWGGNNYTGNKGIDTFYADWSKWTTNVVWKNGGTTSNNVNVTGMERLLIQTGAGNDSISLDANRQDDYISTGKGNDTLSIVGNSGHDYFNGGAGTDAMNLNWSANKNGSISFRTYGSNTATSYTELLDYSSSFSDIKAALSNSYNEEFAFNNGNANNSVRFASVEKINIRGSDGNDLILYWNGSQYHGNGGIDTFYADWSSWKENIVWKNGGTSVAKKVNVTGMERLLIQTGAGNDNISLDANRQNDYISTGKGNDTLSIIGNNGHDYFNGGTGTDAMNLNWSANKNGSISFRTYGSNTATSYTKLLDYSSSFSDIESTLADSSNKEFAFNNGNANNSVRFASVEKINIRGSDGNDLILYWNGSQYHGNGGIDTFYADWSSWKENIVWKNGGTSVAKKVNVTGMERLLIQTGTGNDNISLDANRQNDYISTGKGNDTLSIIGNNGHDYFNGGTGTDAMNLNWSANKNGSISFRTYSSNTATSYIKELSYNSSFSDIEAALSNSNNEEFAFNNGNANNSVRFASVEKINIRGSDGNDLILYWNGSQYHGNGGIDTFYADWSSWKENIVWKNGGTSVAKKVNVSGMERVLLQTGSGKDNIDLSTSKYTNEIHSGAGNDTVKGGSGNDTIYGGDGNDTFSIVGMSGHDYFNGGKGTDAVNLNWSGNQNHRINFRTYKYNTSSGGYSSSYTTELTAASAFADIKKTLDELGNKDEVMFYNYLSSGNSNSLRLQGVEKINIRGSDKDDLILYWNGSQYHGGEGSDTFYADWSSWTESISWKKGGTIVENKVKVSGMDRLFLNSGTGTDYIDLSDTDLNNEVHANIGHDTVIGGAGNDWLYGDAGRDTLYGGAGNDKLFGGTGNDTLYGDDGNDELYGGAGNDILTGGKGNDIFVFDTALGKNNIDTIVDFSTSDDKIALSKAIFTGIRYINSSIFTTGKAATDSNQRIIYDDKSGKLYYDEDGSGAGKAVHFANLNKELDLDYNHFILA